MQILLWLEQGFEAKARSALAELLERPVDGPLAAACLGLAEFALKRDLSRDSVERLAEHFAAIRQDMPLIARMIAELLAASAGKPDPYKAWLANNGADWVGFH